MHNNNYLKKKIITKLFSLDNKTKNKVGSYDNLHFYASLIHGVHLQIPKVTEPT